MENNEKFRLFFEQNNLQHFYDYENQNIDYKMVYNLGDFGTIEIDDIEIEGEYIARLMSTNLYTIIYIDDNTTRTLTFNMDNPL